MKSSNCVINRMDFTRNYQLISPSDLADSLENRPGWCLFLSEEIPSGEIRERTGNDDDTQTVIELLGI